MNKEPNILLHKKDAVCTVTINNPDRHNVLSPQCLYEIADVFRRIGEDDATRVVILRGAGKDAFSAGADISTMSTRDSNHSETSNFQYNDITAVSAAIRNYPYPVIAMLYGYTLGAGCILAMSCDIRVASDKVKMGIPTSRMGLIPNYEGFRRFLIILGYSTALEIFLTGKQYDGKACLTKGLINHLVEDDALEEFTYGLAEEVTRCAPLSLSGTKHILTSIAENPNPSSEQLAHFRKLWDQANKSDDHEEAKSAFKEKRIPLFKGK